MKLFIDSADSQEIKTAWDWGIIDGVTTNPSLAAKAGRPYSEVALQILDILGQDTYLSLEVIATDVDGIMQQAKQLSSMDSRVVVKIPCTQAGVQATHRLSGEGTLVNMTLVFSPAQALLAAKAGAFFVSPFVGRLDDAQEGSGNNTVAEIINIFDNYDFASQVLYSSVRDVRHVEDAAILGADIATVPFKVLQKLVEHPLTDKGLDKFLADWDKAGLTLT
ncbi:fructose-6-phosphate aldolase [Candidatus Dojkabacteria bacterium]|uniref:Fructose-6-phosphate aldolase n=1 Tax=Candidatus Dojkabacteria bacterium TaxID=2099670 RepID=A0A955I779_9BACT|nr:fructose-6-phosphate aldolase [Candidatus Dojkabacteria bacterium]